MQRIFTGHYTHTQKKVKPHSDESDERSENQSDKSHSVVYAVHQVLWRTYDQIHMTILIIHNLQVLK